MRIASIQVNGDSWIKFPLYESLGLTIGFLHCESDGDYKNDSLYRLKNGAKFRIYNLMPDHFLLINDGEESLIEKYISIYNSSEEEERMEIHLILRLIHDGAANYRCRLSRD